MSCSYTEGVDFTEQERDFVGFMVDSVINSIPVILLDSGSVDNTF